MNVVAQIFAGIAALIHLVVWVFEAFMIRDPRIHRGVFGVPTEDVRPVLLWSFGVGFYNLFLGSGTIIGLVLVNVGDLDVGRALVLYTCSFMALSGVVLFIADRLGLGRAKGKGVSGAIGQTTPPLVAILIMAFA